MVKNRAPAQWRPWQALVLYLALGVFWILAGDWAVRRWAPEATAQHFYVWKGWLYVLLTGLLAWWLLRRVQRAERVRAAAEQHMAALLRHAPAGMARLDLQGQVLWANAHFLQMLGGTLEQVQGLPFASLVQAGNPPRPCPRFQRLLAGQTDHYVAQR